MKYVTVKLTEDQLASLVDSERQAINHYEYSLEHGKKLSDNNKQFLMSQIAFHRRLEKTLAAKSSIN